MKKHFKLKGIFNTVVLLMAAAYHLSYKNSLASAADFTYD